MSYLTVNIINDALKFNPIKPYFQIKGANNGKIEPYKQQLRKHYRKIYA